MIRKKNGDKRPMKQPKAEKATRTGLQAKLPGYIRTQKLQEIASNRGMRVRTLRNLLKMNLDEFAEKLDMNPGGAGRIERGHTCLSIDTANWIARKVIEYDILTTSEWLLTGKGQFPQIIKNEQFSIKDCFLQFLESLTGKKEIENIFSRDLIKILSHYFLYKMAYELSQEEKRETMMAIVKNDDMNPIFKKGNLVIAYELKTEEWSTLEGVNCIVKTQDGLYINSVTCLKESQKGEVLLFSLNGLKAHIVSPIKIMKIEHIIKNEFNSFPFETVTEDEILDLANYPKYDSLKNLNLSI